MRRSLLPGALARLVVSSFILSCSGASSPSSDKSRDGALTGEAGAGAVAPSCMAGGKGLTDCGSAGDGSCCASLSVPGGTFFRSYDGVSTNGASKDYPATISAVSVDEYEVTVGRFRRFVAAEVAGWRPSAGSGKHTELASGKGLNDGTEAGWDASWTSNIATTSDEWSSFLACDAPGSTETDATWTASVGPNEDHPINCVDWYEAYAFCIWDGGFLPTEAEWNYTAAGGSDQRVYPWSSPSTSTTLDCKHADYSTSWPGQACAKGTNVVGAESPVGDGKWGHADLAGNVFEWTLDWDAPYSASCDDCANLASGEYRVIRGGSFDGQAVCLLNSLRETSIPDGRSTGVGFRCARP